jgi:hypothetical protein
MKSGYSYAGGKVKAPRIFANESECFHVRVFVQRHGTPMIRS